MIQQLRVDSVPLSCVFSYVAGLWANYGMVFVYGFVFILKSHVI